MKNLTRFFLMLSCCFFAFSCLPRSSTDIEPVVSSDLNLLMDWMTGYFSSLEQSKSDPDYLEIQLHMIQIWPERTDGYWIYVEQALAGHLPYRQRIYHVTQPGNMIFQSQVYNIEEPLRFAGEWENQNPMQSLLFESLIPRDGCEIIMKKKGDLFIGSTLAEQCGSDLRGSSYATSEVTISANKLESWDRGFDNAHQQVWGAEKGGYVFDKIENYPVKTHN